MMSSNFAALGAALFGVAGVTWFLPPEQWPYALLGGGVVAFALALICRHFE
jgi:hypothetical protein